MSDRKTGLSIFVVCVLIVAGCDGPRDRLGALPFPGHFSLYTTADATKLGTHRYERWPRLLRHDEEERGILYTTRGGFIDLAHVRIAIDWTWHCTKEVRAALERGRAAVAVIGPDVGVFHVSLAYSGDWETLSEAERAACIEEASHRIGQRTAYLILTWHEIATWFGYRSFFFDEAPSAFTYDDTIATLLGIRVAERAMGKMSGKSDAEFDAAATAALEVELNRLGPVTPAQTDEAVGAVKGIWWSMDGPLKRQTEVCLCDGKVVYPWLVPNLSFLKNTPAPEGFVLPCDGREAAIVARIEIEPRIEQATAMRALVPGHPQWFAEERDLPALMKVMRLQMQARYGAEVGQPWPGSQEATVRSETLDEAHRGLKMDMRSSADHDVIGRHN